MDAWRGDAAIFIDKRGGQSGIVNHVLDGHNSGAAARLYRLISRRLQSAAADVFALDHQGVGQAQSP